MITHSTFVLKKCALMTKRDHPLPFAFARELRWLVRQDS